MLSAIVVHNGASSDSFQQTLTAACSLAGTELLVIAPDALLTGMTGIIGIDAEQPIRSALSAAFDRATGMRAIVIDARLAPQNHELQAIVGAISKDRTTDYLCASLQVESDTIALSTVGLDDLISLITSNPEWPLLCVGINKRSAHEAAPFEGETLTELLATLLIKGASRGQSIESTHYSLQISADQESLLHLSQSETSRLLRSAVSSCNIEDLFPEHPWVEHEHESAAATYHALAASFVRLGDLEASVECLKLSDKFESSPRSLALKGMIARSKGETLGAVANMVASLQQYEIRKHDTGKHYVRFAPSNVERISDNLQAGLTALNLQDNESALTYFEQAVFSFDPFFKENGLEFKA